MGRSKQLLEFEGETLLQRAARSLAASVYFPVVVVLGAEADAARAEIIGVPIYQVQNDDWRSGMSSSIRAGVSRALEIEAGLDGILIALCDQPRVTSELLDRFAAEFSLIPAPVIAAAYKDTVGVPCLFSRQLFDDLMTLEGDKGARHLIRGRRGVLKIDLPEAAFDIDSPEDLKP